MCLSLLSHSLKLFSYNLLFLIQNLPAVQEMGVQSLGREDPQEKEMATHCSILAWRIPWTQEPGGLQSMGWQRVGRNWATNTCDFTNPALVTFLPSLFALTLCIDKDLEPILLLWLFCGVTIALLTIFSILKFFLCLHRSFLTNFYWSIAALQCCISFAVQQSEPAVHIHTSPLFFISFPCRSPPSLE